MSLHTSHDNTNSHRINLKAIEQSYVWPLGTIVFLGLAVIALSLLVLYFAMGYHDAVYYQPQIFIYIPSGGATMHSGSMFEFLSAQGENSVHTTDPAEMVLLAYSVGDRVSVVAPSRSSRFLAMELSRDRKFEGSADLDTDDDGDQKLYVHLQGQVNQKELILEIMTTLPGQNTPVKKRTLKMEPVPFDTAFLKMMNIVR